MMTMSENNFKIKAALIGFLLFILLTGTAMFVSMHYFVAEYGSSLMMRFMLPAEIAMFIICSFIYYPAFFLERNLQFL